MGLKEKDFRLGSRKPSSSLSGGGFGGEAPSLRVGYCGCTPVFRGVRLVQKRVRSCDLTSWWDLVGWFGTSPSAYPVYCPLQQPCPVSHSLSSTGAMADPAGFQGGPEGLLGEKERAKRPFPLTVRSFLQTSRRRGVFRAGAPEKKRPPRLSAGGLRGEVPCFLVGWFGWIYPCSGEIKEGSFKDGGSLAISFKGWIWCWLAGTSPSLRTTDMCLLLMQSPCLKGQDDRRIAQRAVGIAV
jgi:hypothetical protein